MKLIALRLQDFLNHHNTEIEFGQLTVVAGQNNAGKSAVKDAIEMVLTGTVRTTDRTGRDAADFIRAGAGHFQLEAVVDAAGHDGTGDGGESRPRLTISRSKSCAGDHVLDVVEDEGRTWEGSIPQKQKVLYDVLGAEAGVIRACLHAGRLPVMKPDEQEALIFGTLGLEFTDAQVCELLQESGATEDDVQLLFAGHDLTFLAKPKQEAYGPEIFDETYKFAYEKRRQAKRDLGTADEEFEHASQRATALEREQPRLAKLDDEWLKRNRATLKALEDERDKLNRANGRAEALPELIERDKVRIAELEVQISEAKAWQTDYDKFMKGARASNLDRQVEVTQDDVDTKLRSIEATKHDLSSVDSAIKSFSGDTPTCPLAQTKCPMTKDAQKELLTSLRAQRTKLKKTLSGAEKDLESFKAIADHCRDLQIHRPGSSVGRLEENLGNVREDLKELESQAAEVDAAQVDELNARIEKGRGLLRTVENYEKAKLELSLRKTKRDELAQHVESWERLVKALGSGGAKLRAVEQPLQDLQIRINERLSQFASGYAVAFETENGFELKVRTPATGDEWKKRLSTSERLRIGIALQDALAHLSGLRFLLIDNVDMLDPENRAKVGNALSQWSSDYDTVILLITAGKKLPAVDGRVTYWLSDGQAERIS